MKYINSFFNEYKFPIIVFLVWRVGLSLILLFAINFVPLQKNFLGGGMGNYLKNPYFWSWLNFDGEHYLSIAQSGYKSLQHFYFPLYPVLVGLIASFFNKSIENLALVGLVLSNLSFLFALVGLWKLVRLDYTAEVARTTLVLLTVFPTSFYFGSFYTESLFLLTVVWSFYFFRKSNFFWAAVFGIFASATRSIGVILLPVFLGEYFLTSKHKKNFKLAFLLFIPLGLAAYMYYLYLTTGNAFAFNYSGHIFGEYRSQNPVILPRVIYRYIFKILPNLNYTYFAGTFPTLLEFLVAMWLLTVTIISVSKIRLAYWFYLLGAFITPTLYLSFVSTPRYALVAFPAFIVTASALATRPKVLQLTIFGLLLTVQFAAFAMFSRGFWIS
ncbi:MAG: hypothetical protein AAB546_02735 [Patescibacteria group bacterium]